MIELTQPLFFVIGGAVGVLVPLVLHLIQSRRTVRIPFSTIRFLQLAERKSSNRIKMENLLLWLIRTLLLLALALAFAMPVLRNQAFGKWFGRAGRDVAIVLDGSYSMAYQVGRGTVWEKAIEQAVSIVEGLGEQDRFCLYVARDHVDPVIEQLSGDREEATRRLKALAFSLTPSQLAPATAEAHTVLREAKEKREREIHIITDGQALPWASFGTESSAGGTNAAVNAATNATSVGAWDPRQADERTACFVSLLGATAPENLSTLDVTVEPTLLMAETPSRVRVHLGYTGPGGATAASLYVDDKEIASRSATLAEGAAADLTFSVPPLGEGRHAARVQIPDDNLTVDNEFHFLLRVEDRVPVLGAGLKDDLFFLRAALNAGGADKGVVRSTWVEPQGIGGEKLHAYADILLANAVPLAAQEVAALEKFVESGGLLAVFPGDRGSVSDYQAWRCLPAIPTRVLEPSLAKRKQILHWEAGRHPMLAELAAGSSPPEVTVRKQFAWDKLEQGAVTIITHGDQPFLVGRPYGRGYVMLFSVPSDRTWSDFPLSPYFLPILHQMLQFGAGVGRQAPYTWCTPSLALEPQLPEATASTALQGPDGAAVPIRSTLVDGRTALTVEKLDQAGIYSVIEPGQPPSPALAVNMAREESDLRPLEAASVKGRLGLEHVYVAHDREELLAQIQESRVGRTMGEQLLWLALLLGVIEFFYANRLARSEPALSEKLHIEASGKVPAAAAAEGEPAP